jgi:hypothetical protein
MSQSTVPDIHDRATEIGANFESVMRLGRSALATHDLVRARNYFERAHIMGHECLPQHLEVHRALLSLACRRANPLLITRELYSLVALRLVGAFLRRHNRP